MKLTEQLKNIGALIGSAGTQFYKQFTETLNDYNEIMSAENMLASVSSFDFVCAFRPIAKQLAAGELHTPYRVNYFLLCSEAAEMFGMGAEQADVLWYFNSILINQRNENT